jgi:acyl-coenzyme A synthetase/AMP-(fatty) acid ligase
VERFNSLLERLHGYADLDSLHADGRAHRYADLLREYDAWRGRLTVRAGSVIGLRADYSLASVAALLALFAQGAVVAMIPRGRDADPYLKDARACALLDIDDAGVHRWTELPQPEDHPLLEQLRASNDAGLIIFTSGSSGKPKAAVHSLQRLLYKFRKPGKRFRTLAFLLFDHIAGVDSLLYTLSSGGTVVITRNRSPAAICELIGSARVEVLSASPSFLRLLCVAGQASDADLSSLKIITYGSEPMDPSTLAWLNTRFPNLQISQKYGTTETGSPKSVSRGNDSLWLSMGRGIETKVVDNILYVRSEGMILGYLNAPSPFDAEGWYCTGDLVEVDGEWLRILGRASDLINVGGEKVSPSEVEQVILQLDFVRDAVVAGEKHVLMGQIVTARVTLATDLPHREAIAKIRSHCRSRLPPYKVPVKIDVVEGGLTTDRQKAVRRAS